jgi:Tfp pilus assembly protein PilP
MIAALTLVAAGCGQRETPESQVRAVIARGEAAAEARSLADLMDLVSPAYQDEQGSGPGELKQYLRGYLVTHQSIRLLARVESVEFPYQDYAKVNLTLGTLGRDTASANAIALAADVYDVQLELQFEDGDWKVTRARWRPASE